MESGSKKKGYSAFWKNLPWAMLFSNLNPPNAISYEDLSQLLKAALIAHSGKSTTGQSKDPLSAANLCKKHERLVRSGILQAGADLTDVILRVVAPS